jgi:N-acetylglucosaminyldiphosphoundecaprenol N-acetyl-beta-D-mannosaminyltransferase
MDYDVFVDKLSEIVIKPKTKQVISTINAYSYVKAKSDPEFSAALHSSDTILPDGGGIVLAAKRTIKQRINRVAGADLHDHLLHQLNKDHGKCFYLGATLETLAKIRQRLSHDYPNIIVATYSPPFKAVFSQEDNAEIIKNINTFSPDVLFIGMTAPKQEKWIVEQRDKLEFKIAAPIGAVFDFYAGNTPRAPLWMQKNHLEWLHRSFSSWRLAKRYLISNPQFIMDVYLYNHRHKQQRNKTILIKN